MSDSSTHARVSPPPPVSSPATESEPSVGMKMPDDSAPVSPPPGFPSKESEPSARVSPPPPPGFPPKESVGMKMPDYSAPVSPPPGFSPAKESEPSVGLKLPDDSAPVSPPPGFSPAKESKPDAGIKETGLTNQHAEGGGEENPINAEGSRNTDVDPSQVQISSAEVDIDGLEDRIRNAEKLLAWIKSGKLVRPRP